MRVIETVREKKSVAAAPVKESTRKILPSLFYSYSEIKTPATKTISSRKGDKQKLVPEVFCCGKERIQRKKEGMREERYW